MMILKLDGPSHRTHYVIIMNTGLQQALLDNSQDVNKRVARSQHKIRV